MSELNTLRAEVEMDRSVAEGRHLRTNKELKDLGDVSRENQRILDEVAGRDGKSGMIHALRQDTDDHEDRLRVVEKMAIRATVIAGLVAAGAATLLGYLVQFLPH